MQVEEQEESYTVCFTKIMWEGCANIVQHNKIICVDCDEMEVFTNHSHWLYIDLLKESETENGSLESCWKDSSVCIQICRILTEINIVHDSTTNSRFFFCMFFSRCFQQKNNASCHKCFWTELEIA